MINYEFKTINLNRAWYEVFSNNETIDIYRKFGFVDEGKLRQHHYEDRQYLDCFMLSLLKDEWLKKEIT